MTRPDDETPREALGDDLWEALGAARSPPAAPPGAPEAIRRRAKAPARRWVWAAVALAAAGCLAALGGWWRLGPRPAADEALVAELDLVENLDLVAHPDFEVVLAWDGEAP
jgi:ferric-dicitrate binding protein FerR (iron transport regulator)